MTNNPSDLMFATLESYSEIYLTEKCNNLLIYYNKEMLLTYVKNSSDFSSVFANSIISEKEMHFILLKKYYLSAHTKSSISSKILYYINNQKFADLETLISRVPMLRRELLENYFNNMNTSNHQLSITKRNTTSYEEINYTLNAMSIFYANQIHGEPPQLKRIMNHTES